eukprot:comp20181_c0_seq1/m.25026 comp20181_c0_seq1/g.25026  ORF comp20181_c0_seq1/g.25026 comp20181_c0_seq1/m.25026 type:complete len:423 (-) comp20181_c0_seq1:367-1635(-)
MAPPRLKLRVPWTSFFGTMKFTPFTSHTREDVNAPRVNKHASHPCMRARVTCRSLCFFSIFYALLASSIWVSVGLMYTSLSISETEPKSVSESEKRCPNPSSPSSTIVLFSDVHINPILPLTDITTRAFVSREADNPSVEGCIVLGDMLTWGGGYSGDVKPSPFFWKSFVVRFLWAFAPIIKRFETIYYIPGNHDVNYGPLPQRYVEHFGQANRYVRVGNFSVFLHNAMNPCNRSADVLWNNVDVPCSKDLAPPQPGTEVDFVASHIPEMNGFGAHVLPIVRPRAVFSGHEHRALPIYRHTHTYAGGNGQNVIVPEIELGSTLYLSADGPFKMPSYMRLTKYGNDGCMEYVVVALSGNGRGVFKAQLFLSILVPPFVFLACWLAFGRWRNSRGQLFRTFSQSTNNSPEYIELPMESSNPEFA